MNQAKRTEELMPITPAIVKWARERAGYSLAEAKTHFGKIAEWESGNLYPTYPQIEQMAETFKVPVAVFFFPEPPKLPKIDETFRTLTSTDLAEIPPKIRLLLRKASSMQINLSELNDGSNPAKKLLTRDMTLNVDKKIKDVAQQLREYLNVSLEEQISWKNSEIALENWRQCLNEVGIFVFKDAFKENNYYGFCLYDNEFPIIYVNNTCSKNRQIFTIFHELAHLMFHTSGIDVINDEYIHHLADNNKKIEIVCNHFAGCFLVPDDVFNEMQSNLPITRQSAEYLAEQFNVSREVIYRKYLDRGLISSGEYSSAVRLWNSSVNTGDGGNYYNNQMAYLGRKYVGLAFEKYYQNKFDSVQLADYLNIKPKNIPGIEEKFLQAIAR